MVIQELHEKIFTFSYNKHQENRKFKFTTRIKNNRDRLSKGYWFTGGEDYIDISFWKGKDSIAKINKVGFTVLLRKRRQESYYYFSCKDKIGCEVIEKLKNRLKVPLFRNPNNNYWEKTLISELSEYKQVLKSLDDFLNNEKVIIDKIIMNNPNEGIGFIEDNDFLESINKIQIYRKQR